ncbi:V-type ATP synthase subunit E [Caviibacter abscessus]|uniref:V-type ATP synthase subunit E n=1 Tax=Caviibacter abscessus TaxID=1766719 RepID=UPI00083230E2|nr:V-type ATP synthase subunit E [Caviibacter abscessus]
MENLERIVAKIVEEANEKAKFILSEANEKAGYSKKQYEDKALKEVEKLKVEYEIQENSGIEKIKSSTKLKARNIILDAKQNAISNIFDKLNEEIKNISSDKILSYIHKILDNRQLAENENIILPKAYENMNLGLENVKFSDKINTGFMIEKNGIFENYSLEALISYNKDEIISKIKQYLFD